MPEGDSLRRAEALLAPVLEGEAATALWFRKLRGHRPRVGQTILEVHAIGKHLLIDFAPKLTLRTHLGMSGSWRVIEPDASPPASPKLRIVIATAKGTALCFAAPTIDTFVRDTGTSPVDHLGPDLSEDVVDFGEVLARVRRFGQNRGIGEALLDQRIAAGIGNVFKSEVCFVCRIHPFTPVAAVTDAQIERIWKVANSQLVRNRSLPARRTTSPLARRRVHVYDRFRQACPVCSDSIAYAAAGDRSERSTYWCPRCQPAPT